MKALVVYYSRFGNTQRVAETIVAALALDMSVELLHLDGVVPPAFEEADLVVMGSPTHKMNLPQAARPVLDALPKNLLKGVAFAAFDTSYEMSWLLNRFTAGKRLDRKLRKLGGGRVLPPEIFVVTGREGPLAEGELARARAWAQALVAKLSARSPALRAHQQPAQAVGKLR